MRAGDSVRRTRASRRWDDRHVQLAVPVVTPGGRLSPAEIGARFADLMLDGLRAGYCFFDPSTSSPPSRRRNKKVVEYWSLSSCSMSS